MRIAIDVMGGDNAPDAILDGAISAIELLGEGDQLVLIGDEAVIREGLEEEGFADDPRVVVDPTTQVIEMGDKPVDAIRAKPDSSVVRMGRLGSKKVGADRCDVVISAGNTGACVAAAQMHMRRLRGVHRPGIAIVLPTFYGPVVICDVGANPEPKPGHLHQYAHMASIYAEKVLGIDEPRAAVMSIGGEESKGNTLVRETHKLVKDDEDLNYIGYCEGRELFQGKTDVVVCEGFTGNVVLKLAEGLSKGIFEIIAQEVFEHDPDMALQLEPVVKNIWSKYDYHEYGGAPLLGANGICMICHGSSEARTIKNAVRRSINFAASGVNEAIIESLGKLEHLDAATETKTGGPA
ncbi:MAG: phosphate acyltransferase PlsX [Planctomycetota bacterium]